MIQKPLVSIVLCAFVFSLTGCAGEPSLTGEQLRQRYPDQTYMSIDGVSLRYRQIGLGRPLVFLHGFLEDSRIWRQVTPGLTYGNTVYELDLMGCGLSEKPQDQTYDIATHVRQVRTFIETFHLENIILAGHDFGGIVATAYALRYPDNVHKLALMSTPLSSDPLSLNVRLLGIRFVGEALSGDWMLRRILKDGVLQPDAMSDAKVQEYLEPYQHDPGARRAVLKLLREFNLNQVIEREILPKLDKLAMPTLLVWGGQDPYTTMDLARQLDVAIPQADLQVVTNTGHYLLEERPEQVRAILKEFIDT